MHIAVSFPTHVLTPRLCRVLGFWLVCCLLWAAPALAASVSAQYENAKSDMARLLKDEKRNLWREPWLELAERFYGIYQKGTSWASRPAALMRSAEALDQLARRSVIEPDIKAARDRYQLLAQKHPTNPLADDALFAEAKVVFEVGKDTAGALEILADLERRFPQGDMIPAVKQLSVELKAKSSPQTGARAEAAEARAPSGDGISGTAAVRKLPGSGVRLTQVIWQSRKNLVRVTLELDRECAWSVRALEPDPKDGRPARLVVNLPGVTPDSQVKPGAKIASSLLTRLRVDLSSPGTTRLMLDFSALKRFTVSTEKTPFRLVITAAATDGALPQGQQPGTSMQSPNAESRSGAVSVPADIAAQLGLTMRTVVLDPGHGGSDPGTEHNGIVERDIALDVAKTVGKLLEKRGFRVIYTRDKNVRVSLENRARIANEAKGDILVSIHVNAHADETINGFESYFLDFASSNAAARLASVENALSDRKLGDLEGILADLMLGARTQESRRLAASIQRRVIRSVKKADFTVRDGGARSAPFHVLLGAGMPGVLVELGYCTNKPEAQKLGREAYRTAMATGIVEGVVAYAARLEKKK